MPDPQNPWQVVSEAPAPQQSAPVGGGQDPWKVVSEAPAPASGNGQSDDQSVLNNDPVTGAKIADLGTGLAKGAGQTVNAVSKLFKGGQEFLDRHPVLRAGAAAATLGGSEVAHAVGSAIPQQGIKAADKMEELQGPDQKIGGGLEAAAEFMLGDEALKGLSLADKIPLIGKAMKSLEEAPSLLKNVLAHMTKTGARNATVGGVQALAHGASPGEALETAAATGGIGAGAEAIGGGVSTLLGKVKGGAAAKSAAKLEKAVSVSAEDATKGSSGGVKPAGERVQSEAAASKDAKGKAVGKTKEVVEKKLPEGGLPFKKSALDETTKRVLNDTADTEQLAGAKDPDMAGVRDIADHLSQGKNAKGEDLVARPQEYESVTRAFDSKINDLKAKQVSGKNSTALRHMFDLKSAYQNDYFDSIAEGAGDKEVAALRDANKAYAQASAEQAKGPAASIFKTQKPSTIIPGIVKGGATSQDVVESILKNSSKEGQAALQKDVEEEILRQSALPDGTIDGVKANRLFTKLGDTGKKLYGPDFEGRKAWYDAVEDATRVENKPSIKHQAARAAIQTGGAVLGGTLGSPLGAAGTAGGAAAGYAGGGKVADFLLGKSGAVKIGISPTEKIVLSPIEVAAKRPTITKFLKAKSAGNTAAMAAAYNALAGKKNDSQDRGSL